MVSLVGRIGPAGIVIACGLFGADRSARLSGGACERGGIFSHRAGGLVVSLGAAAVLHPEGLQGRQAATEGGELAAHVDAALDRLAFLAGRYQPVAELFQPVDEMVAVELFAHGVAPAVGDCRTSCPDAAISASWRARRRSR